MKKITMTFECERCGKEKEISDVYDIWYMTKNGWRTHYGQTYCPKCVKKIEKLGIDFDRELDTAMVMSKAYVMNIAGKADS